MIIDIHNHADYCGYNFEKLMKDKDECGIDITCILPWECPETDFIPSYRAHMNPDTNQPVPFAKCLEYKEKAPNRFVLGYAPDPRHPDSINKLKAAVALYDIGIFGEVKLRMMYDDFDAIRMFRVCGEFGLPVLLHFDYETNGISSYPWPSHWYGGDIHTLERVLAKCPETNFLGHAPGFWVHISDDEYYKTEVYPKRPIVPGGGIERLLEKYPNLYCDMCGGSGLNAMDRDHEFSKKFITTWQDRVVFGRDYCDTDNKDLLDSLGLADNVYEKLYSGNAKRLLRGGDKL